MNVTFNEAVSKRKMISCRDNHYLTRAVSSPTSDLGKEVLSCAVSSVPCGVCRVAELSGFLQGIYWLDFYEHYQILCSQLCLPLSGKTIQTITILRDCSNPIALFWQGFEQLARSSMSISKPSQITVDCKSVHLSLHSRLHMLAK